MYIVRKGPDPDVIYARRCGSGSRSTKWLLAVRPVTSAPVVVGDPLLLKAAARRVPLQLYDIATGAMLYNILLYAFINY